MSKIQSIKLLNGPNLNLLGQREPAIYGSQTLTEIEERCQKRAKELDCSLKTLQSNAEGELIDAVQACLTDGTRALIINPGGYAHTSIALRDAVSCLKIPKAEVHLSNIYAREPFRQHSYLSGVVDLVVCGAKAEGYIFAVETLARMIGEKA